MALCSLARDNSTRTKRNSRKARNAYVSGLFSYFTILLTSYKIMPDFGGNTQVVHR